MQAEIRTWANDPAWIQYGDGDEEATVSYASGTSFTVAGADVTAVYHAGRRVRATGTSTGDIAGTIVSSSFSTDTTVNVEWDDGNALANEAIVVYISALPQETTQLPAVALQKPNILANGEFQIWQNGSSFTSGDNDDDSYTADQCILLSDGNDIVDVSRSTTLTPGGYGFAILQSDVETASKKFGYLFPVENVDAVQLAGGTCSLSFKARDNSGNTTLETIRAAVLEWTGTADSITSDVVSAWNNSSTDPTLVANWAYANTPFDITLTTTLTEYRINNIDVSSSAANVAVFIWVQDTDATVADLWYLADVNLVAGPVATPIMRQPFGEALRRCQRYFCKTFPYATTPVANAGVNGALNARGTSSSGNFVFDWRFPVEMRTSPTYQTYNPSVAASALARNVDNSTNRGVSNVTTGTSGAAWASASPDAGDADDRLIVHVTADARL